MNDGMCQCCGLLLACAPCCHSLSLPTVVMASYFLILKVNYSESSSSFSHYSLPKVTTLVAYYYICLSWAGLNRILYFRSVCSLFHVAVNISVFILDYDIYELTTLLTDLCIDDYFEVCFCSDSCEHVYAFLLNVDLQVLKLSLWPAYLEHMTSGWS